MSVVLHFLRQARIQCGKALENPPMYDSNDLNRVGIIPILWFRLQFKA